LLFLIKKDKYTDGLSSSLKRVWTSVLLSIKVLDKHRWLAISPFFSINVLKYIIPTKIYWSSVLYLKIVTQNWNASWMYHHRCTTFISNRIGTLTAVAKPTLYCFARMEGIYDKRHSRSVLLDTFGNNL